MCATGGTITVEENVLLQLLQWRCVITRYVMGPGAAQGYLLGLCQTALLAQAVGSDTVVLMLVMRQGPICGAGYHTYSCIYCLPGLLR
jgi:hypothetical protein